MSRWKDVDESVVGRIRCHLLLGFFFLSSAKNDSYYCRTDNPREEQLNTNYLVFEVYAISKIWKGIASHRIGFVLTFSTVSRPLELGVCVFH